MLEGTGFEIESTTNHKLPNKEVSHELRQRIHARLKIYVHLPI